MKSIITYLSFDKEIKSAICSGSKKSMEILFNVQLTLHSKNKSVLGLSEHECRYSWLQKNGNCQNKIDTFLQFFHSVKPSYERYSPVKNKLLSKIRTFREITLFMLCATRIFKSNFEWLRLVTMN
jgi:hypothetical protein